MKRPVLGSEMAEARLLDVVLSEHADQNGALHGASALRIMGKAAYVCARPPAACSVSLAKADSIEFASPFRVGAILDIRARVVFQGHSSMTVVVEIGDDAGRSDAPAISGRFMMVAVDAACLPVPIKTIQPPVEEAVS